MYIIVSSKFSNKKLIVMYSTTSLLVPQSIYFKVKQKYKAKYQRTALDF